MFAGVGGIRIPFEELGGKCVFTSEWDKFSQITYEANFGEKPHGDITQIDEKDIPKHNLLLAGFPCQAFSQAGLKKGFQDTRGTMFFEIARILDHHKPNAFLLENVKGLRGHDKGNTFKTIVSILNELGYQTLESEVLNAKHFGLPQNRERIFIVGFKKNVNFQFPTPPETSTRLGNILQKKVSSKYTISDKLWAGAQARKQKHLDESFLVMFGSWVQWLLGKMFDGGSIPGTIKGSKSEVESFARAMGSEKRYIETAKRYGLDHPTTYKSKAKLSSATKGFEKETGIKWPFE